MFSLSSRGLASLLRLRMFFFQPPACVSLCPADAWAPASGASSWLLAGRLRVYLLRLAMLCFVFSPCFCILLRDVLLFFFSCWIFHFLLPLLLSSRGLAS